MAELVLASRSPQRRAILDQLGISFTARTPYVEELEEGPAIEVVLENAHRKAAAVAGRRADRLVLGVDTVVHLGGRIYGKAADLDAARATLRTLSGRRHEVISGICLLKDGTSRRAAVQTLVEFRTLDDGLIEWYLASEEWRERAGCYAIQGRGAALVAGIEGDYLNVVGLPIATLLELEPGLLERGPVGA
ncbi:MAG: Maf family protein [Actinomycetota bacterium]|nr:Maf family protein [Actinomycetota bacterium]